MSKYLLILASLLWPALTLAQEIRYVDTSRLLTESKPAQAAKVHVEEARKILEKGYNDLQKAWEKSDQKEKILLEGLQSLNRQMRIEEQAALNVVANLMKEEISAWRKQNKVDLVLARQDILDVAENLDITDNILENLNRREAKFADLPSVSIKEPPKEASEKITPAQESKKAKK